jgi:hypothetical protein
VESSRFINVTPFGAGFKLKHPIEKGRLLHLTAALPRQLRVFDHVEDQYRIWALVRYVRSLLAEPDQAPVFQVGVAFVGKHPPKSYGENPAKRYQIAASAIDTMTLEDADQIAASSADHRKHTRHIIPVDMLLETLDEKGGVALSESTVTEDINHKGARLFTSLDIPEGRFVRLTSQQFRLTMFAVVRSTSAGTDGIRRIHLEFIGREWPL